jgi:4-amino-4-deoxy-L-arabinose transferase-like glycosyltransferase
VALIVFACVFWGAFADIDAPFVYHPDEPDVVGRAVTMLVTGDLNPHWFHYPTLPIYLYAAVFKALGLFVDIPLELGVFVEVQGANPEVFLLYHVSRFITICFAVGTLAIILQLATRMTSPLVALLAGLTFVGSEIVRQSATSATVDMPMTFFVVASLALMVGFVDSAERGRAKERLLWLAVMMGGLAASVKYNGGAVLLAVPLAMWLAGMPLGKALRKLPLMALLSIAVLVATTPWSILDAKTFFSTRGGMLFHFTHYTSGHVGADEGSSLLKAMSELLRLHSPLAVLALISPLAARDAALRKPLWLVGFTAILFLGMVGVANVYFTRNVLPFTPALDCLIAVGAWAAMGKSSSNAIHKKMTLRATAPLLALLVVAGAITLRATFDVWRQADKTDNRTLAYEWINSSIAPGSHILQEAYCPQLQFSKRFEITYFWTVSQIPFKEVAKTHDYVVVSEKQWERYNAWGYRTYDPLFERRPLREWGNAAGESRGPTIRLYSIDSEAGP